VSLCEITISSICRNFKRGGAKKKVLKIQYGGLGAKPPTAGGRRSQSITLGCQRPLCSPPLAQRKNRKTCFQHTYTVC